MRTNRVCGLLLAVLIGGLPRLTAAAMASSSPLLEPALVAVVSWEDGVLYVASGKRELLASHWKIGEPQAAEWLLEAHNGKKVPLFIAELPQAALADIPLTKQSVLVREGMACTGNRPPGTDDTGCIRQAGGVNRWYQVKQTVGYSFCRTSQNSLCEEALVQIGEWIFYKDKCHTETRRVPKFSRVCLP